MFKKIIMLSLLMISVLCLLISRAFAAPDNSNTSELMQPEWTYLYYVTNYFDIDASGEALMDSQMQVYDGYADNVKMNNYLQRYNNGSWTTVKSWSQSTDGTYAFWSGSYYVYEGYYYRLYTYYYVYHGSTLLEYTSMPSVTVYY